MSEHHENELLHTTCTECQSVFHLNLPQLLAADGKVRCSECNEVFDANIHLVREHKVETSILDEIAEDCENKKSDESKTVSLHEAMNDGGDSSRTNSFISFYWLMGILLLAVIALVQWVYFDRLQLVNNPKRQNLVLNLCSFIPCDTSLFKSTNQFKLIERNIFTHPTQANALLISGSYVNEAPFSQKTPSLKVSLFNLNGEIIAQRLFTPIEYSIESAALTSIAPGENIHFKIEIADPNTVTITYEFEFI